jgi:hypothetical protein
MIWLLVAASLACLVIFAAVQEFFRKPVSGDGELSRKPFSQLTTTWKIIFGLAVLIAVGIVSITAFYIIPLCVDVLRLIFDVLRWIFGQAT